MKKRLAVTLAAVALSVVMSVPAYAGTWKYVNDQWKYQRGANKFAYKEWIEDNGNWYYMDNNGVMTTGWQQIDGLWYYLNPVSDGTRGARKTSYQMIDGKWYFFDTATGAMWFNRQAPNGKWIDANGVVW